MKKLNSGANFIICILLVMICVVCTKGTAIADLDKSANVDSDGRIQEYVGAVQAKIKSNWKPNIDKDVQTVCPTVRFMILPDGQVRDVVINRSSNNLDIDSSAIAAVKIASPFPAITIAPYDKDGLPIEIDFNLNVLAADNQEDVNVSNIISQADQTFDKGNWQSGADILNTGLKKYPNNTRLKNSLSIIYSNQATLLMEKSPQSADGLELAQKALLLNPDNDAAKQLLPATWTVLDCPEFAFSTIFPEDARHIETDSPIGKIDNWTAHYNDSLYSVSVCKFNESTQLVAKTISGQQTTLEGLVNSFFGGLGSGSDGTLTSKNLIREYKRDKELAKDYSFSLLQPDGKTVIEGKSTFCVGENFGYNFFALTPQDKLKQADPFFLSIKINSSLVLSGKSTNDDNDLTQGNIDLKHKEYDKAVNEFSKVIERQPQYAKAYFRRAMAYENLKQYQKAVDDLTTGIKFDPDNASAYSGRGIIYWQLGQSEKAIDDCSKAIQLNPSGVAGYGNRGIIYCKLKQYQKSVDDCSKAIELDSKLGALWSNRAAAYCGLGEYQKAIANCNIAIAMNPKLASAYAIRGEAFFETKQYQKAIDDCSQAIVLAPAMGKAYRFRAEAYKAVGKNDLAAKDNDTAQKMADDQLTPPLSER